MNIQIGDVFGARRPLLNFLSAGLALGLGFSAGRVGGDAQFKVLTVERINVVEPDGTIRTVISNKALFPGTYRKNVEHPREDRPTAGAIFMDDEGSEIGGLVYGGSKSKDGKVESHGHLSFDQYNATQVFSVDAWEQDGERAARLKFWDWRDDGAQNSAARLVLGKTTDKNVGLSIMDSKGQARIVCRVRADDTPELLFLDAEGKVVKRIEAK